MTWRNAHLRLFPVEKRRYVFLWVETVVLSLFYNWFQAQNYLIVTLLLCDNYETFQSLGKLNYLLFFSDLNQICFRVINSIIDSKLVEVER